MARTGSRGHRRTSTYRLAEPWPRASPGRAPSPRVLTFQTPIIPCLSLDEGAGHAHGRRPRQSARRRPLRHQTVQDLVGLDRLSGGQGGRARAGTIPSRRHGARVHVPFRPHTRRDVKSAYSAFLNRWAVARVRCAVLLHTCPVRAHSRFRDLKYLGREWGATTVLWNGTQLDTRGGCGT